MPARVAGVEPQASTRHRKRLPIARGRLKADSALPCGTACDIARFLRARFSFRMRTATRRCRIATARPLHFSAVDVPTREAAAAS
jgi:hypothetical protein